MEEVYIKNWKALFELDIADSTSFYRGQSDANWPLESSLRRSAEGKHYQDDVNNNEFWCLREFKRRSPSYLDRIPNDGDYIAWLSLMQHHGTPTRLLDFSHSFYVACYFALRDATSDAAVWSIDYSWLNSIATSCFNIELNGLRDEGDDSVYSHTNNLLSRELKTASGSGEKCPLGVVFVDPTFLHRRLASQQGLFLVPLNIEVGFMENLENHTQKYPRQFRKIVLSHDMKEEAIAHFRSMNITEETLFADLDGLAREIKNKELY